MIPCVKTDIAQFVKLNKEIRITDTLRRTFRTLPTWSGVMEMVLDGWVAAELSFLEEFDGLPEAGVHGLLEFSEIGEGLEVLHAFDCS